MNLSNGYMLRRNTGPHILISYTMWTMRWTIISKKDGGKYISTWHTVSTAAASSSSSSNTSIVFCEILLKKKHRFMIVSWTLRGRIFLIAIGMIYVIIT